MAKDLTLKTPDGSTTLYPKTVSNLVYDNETGTPISNWIKGLDNEPITDSKNLITSGAIVPAFLISKSSTNYALSDFIQNYGIDYSSGNIVSAANTILSGYIKIPRGATSIIVSRRKNAQKGLCFYSSDLTKIKPSGESQFSTTNANGTFTIPNDAMYLRIATRKVNSEISVSVQFDNDEGYDTYNGIIIRNDKLFEELALQTHNDFHLIDTKVELTVGYGIDYDSGEVVEYSASSVSDVIPCENVSYIVVTNRQTNKGLVFYDKDGQKIKPYLRDDYSTDSPNGTFNIPLNAVSFRIASSSSVININIDFSTINDKNQRIDRISGYRLIDSEVIEYGDIKKGNIYNLIEDIRGYALDYSTGAMVATSSGTVSKLISVTPNSFYNLSGRTSHSAKGLVGYDKDGNIIMRSLITGSTSTGCFGDSLNGVIKTGDDVVAIRFTTDYNSGQNRSNILLEEIIENIFSTDNLTTGGLDYNTGTLVSSNNYKTTPFIKVSKNATYQLSGRKNSTSKGIVGYNENYEVIDRNPIDDSTGQGKFGTVLNGFIHTRDDISYIRFTCYSSYNTQSETEQLRDIVFSKCPGTARTSGTLSINEQGFIAKSYIDESGIIHSFSGSSDNYPIQSPLDRIISGKGTETEPYISADGTAGIKACLAELTRGGKVRIPAARFNISTPIVIDGRSIKIEGDSWNYSNDPNGVYASGVGSKLSISEDSNGLHLNNASGATITDIGFQGVYTVGNTRSTFDKANPTKNAGLVSVSGRNDQMYIARVSAQGLAAGFSIVPNGDIDATIFERLNGDGCNIAFFFSPKNTYYAKVRDSIFADCPAYGLCAIKSTIQDAGALQMLTIDGIVCVRNGGAFSQEQLTQFGSDMAAGMLVSDVSNSMIINNQIDNSGTYWDTTQNSTLGYLYEYANSYDIIRRNTGEVYATKDYIYDCHGLILKGTTTLVSNNRVNGTKGGYALKIIGNSNNIINNTLSGTKGIYLNGNSNNVTNNVVNGEIEIYGNNNKLSDILISSGKTITVHSGNNNYISFCRTSNGTYPNIIIDAGVTNTIIEGVPQNFITDNGSGTIIK